MSVGFKELDINTLKKLRKVQLEILSEIDRICKKNKIEYFLVYGTLLGAVRHKGFIPWDDDLDIGMTRENYDKFMRICFNDLDDKYYLHCLETDKNYYLPFAKVRKNNTTFDEENISNFKTHKGIYVDIFPFDKIKKNTIFTRLQVITIRTIVETVFLKKKIYEKSSQCRHPLYSKILSIFSCKFLFKFQNNLIKLLSDETGEYYASFLGSYAFHKEYFLKEKLFPLTYLEFEGRKYPTFKNYDEYLTTVYGDYMTLPPKEKRANHSALKIDFYNGMNLKTNGGK